MAKMTLDELRAKNPSLSPKKEGHPPKEKAVLSHAGLPRADEPVVVPVPDVAAGEAQAVVSAPVVMDVAPKIEVDESAPKAAEVKAAVVGALEGRKAPKRAKNA